MPKTSELPTVAAAGAQIVVNSAGNTAGKLPITEVGPKAATVSEIRTAAVTKSLSSDTIWTAAAGVDQGNMTGTVTLDFSTFLGCIFGTATGNITLGAVTNAKPGQTATMDIKQDATGGRTLSVNATYWLVSAGSVPTWDTSPNARNVLVAVVLRDGKVLLTIAGKGIA